MSCITEITALHEVPGRVRYFVPQIKSSPANATVLRDYLKKLPGVYHAKSCPTLGTLIIYFDAEELTKDSLHEHIHDCELPETVIGPTHAPEPVRIPHHHRTALQYNDTAINNEVWMELLKQGLRAAGVHSSGGIGLGISALRTLLSVTSRVH